MRAHEVPTSKIEQFKTFRTLVTPKSREELMSYIEAMDEEIRQRKFTGKLTIEWNQGGARLIVAEQVASDFVETEN